MDVKSLVVPNCPNEQRARVMLGSAFADPGAGDTAVRTVVVGTAGQAKQLGFAGSPAVLLAGPTRPPQPNVPKVWPARCTPSPAADRRVSCRRAWWSW